MKVRVKTQHSENYDHGIQSHDFSWQIDGEIMETVRDFVFLQALFSLFSCKITADGDCSNEIKRCLLLGRKAMTNLDRILKTEILLC